MIWLMTLFCFYPWPYIVNVKTCSRKTAVFSIAVHVLRNLFWKYAPICANFNHVFEVFQGFFFVFLL